MTALPDQPYSPDETRYNNFPYNRCGNSGLLLPPLSLGLWHNFGGLDDAAKASEMIRTAFDSGITSFDLANNYGPPPGSAETTFGQILKQDFANHRDELVIATKAGHLMWDGPYGDWGSRKHLLASLDQSLNRLGLDYVDIFYIHRFDPVTPLEETVGALADAVRSGRALYVGISKFPPDAADRACGLLKESNIPCIIHQTRYNMFDRGAEQQVFPFLERHGLGCSVFSPLAQGMLTERYLDGIPSDSRAAGNSSFLDKDRVDQYLPKIRLLARLARERGQHLSQMAVSWVLNNPHVTTAIIGASKPEQITDCLAALQHPRFSDEELGLINEASMPETN